jgi:hypothetical protein
MAMRLIHTSPSEEPTDKNPEGNGSASESIPSNDESTNFSNISSSNSFESTNSASMPIEPPTNPDTTTPKDFTFKPDQRIELTAISLISGSKYNVTFKNRNTDKTITVNLLKGASGRPIGMCGGKPLGANLLSDGATIHITGINNLNFNLKVLEGKTLTLGKNNKNTWAAKD